MGRQLADEPALARLAPAEVPELSAFECGATAAFEQTANALARRLAGRELGPRSGLVVTREREHNDLIGVVAWSPQSLRKGYLRGILIEVIALSADYRGAVVRATRERVADLLLARCLEEISRDHPDEPFPHCWAGIHPENTRSVALFERHGFEMEPLLRGDDFVLWFREGEEPLA